MRDLYIFISVFSMECCLRFARKFYSITVLATTLKVDGSLLLEGTMLLHKNANHKKETTVN